MKNRIIFGLAVFGVGLGLFSAHYFSTQKKPQNPVFNPAPNPYQNGIYANGIIESFQTNGANINVYPEVSGTVAQILVSEGQSIRQGTPVLALEDSVPRANAAQLKAQAAAALVQLNELKAQPRPEVLQVSKAQMDSAAATRKNSNDQLNKLKRSYRLNPKSVSKNDLDNSINAFKIADANLQVAQKQYELTKAGAWRYDIENQENQYQALLQSAASASALLTKYTIKAPIDSVVLSINSSVGSFLSAQGTYNPYTQGLDPAVVMGGSQNYLQVRCYVDEILIQHLPPVEKMTGQMFVRGTDAAVPLEFLRMQPYVTPKIQLSDQRLERVDVRVLPIIFKFEKPKGLQVFPGQLVDVYVGEGARPNQLGGQVPKDRNTKK